MQPERPQPLADAEAQNLGVAEIPLQGSYTYMLKAGPQRFQLSTYFVKASRLVKSHSKLETESISAELRVTSVT